MLLSRHCQCGQLGLRLAPMSSPYQRAKPHVSSFEIPELRHELLFTQRTLYEVCQRESGKKGGAADRPQEKLMKLIGEAFPENLHDLAEDFHNVCDWAVRREPPSTEIIKTAILFAGALLQRKEVSTAIPLLKKLEGHVGGDRELKSVWAINYAIANERMSGAFQETLWEMAIQEMPLNRWMQYPSLVDGARIYIRKLRRLHEESGDLTSLLAAAPLTERAYLAVTHRDSKGSSFESSGPAVRLLVEIARAQHALSNDAFGPLSIPTPTLILEQAAVNAAVNRTEEDLFVRTLTTLADYHSSCGRRDEARELALRALVECGSLGKKNPKLLETIQAIFEANK